ncbi:occludin/ELL domain-containing protein 1 [Apteryx mantelli]|uniref:Occludin/ELL domain-containing protein 1 n=1 Tax=Apteryx mantelli TaxID=2696672 RepID=A0ABM4FW43_9AVES
MGGLGGGGGLPAGLTTALLPSSRAQPGRAEAEQLPDVPGGVPSPAGPREPVARPAGGTRLARALSSRPSATSRPTESRSDCPAWKSWLRRWRGGAVPRCPPQRASLEHRGPDRHGSSGHPQGASGSGPAGEQGMETEQGLEMGLEPSVPRGRPAALPDAAGRLEAYGLKYAYMKSWPGLLRVLGGLQLLFGGMVFACVCAYVQRDYRWYGSELLADGTHYAGPLTPFVLVVASLAWLLSAILLGLGATTYYRSILLDAGWWPPTEAALNALLFLLYLAAAAAYVNTVTLGGLCYSPLAGGPLLGVFCRMAGGQAAALVFLFITALLYLAASLVCLKMWRHETARRRREMLPAPAPPAARAKRIVFEDEMGPPGRDTGTLAFLSKGEKLEALSCSVPTGLTPQPRTVPDYVEPVLAPGLSIPPSLPFPHTDSRIPGPGRKYPAIRSPWEREQYKAVFCDQYAEYKELHGEVRAALQKFGELDAMMCRLPWHTPSREEQRRVARVWREYTKKKRDSAFLEKQERCDYLKKKLMHIKSQIREYDRATPEGSVCF